MPPRNDLNGNLKLLYLLHYVEKNTWTLTKETALKVNVAYLYLAVT